MPDGRPESPLNKLADALPGFILQMQNMKLRQDATEALQSWRWATLEEEGKVREALDQVRREMGYYEPPEAKLLRDSIASQYRTLNDPDIGLTLDDEVIEKRWKKLRSDEADYFGKYGRHISLSMPIPVEGALARIEAAKPPPSAIITPVEGEPKPRVFETKEEYQKRISEPTKPPEPKRPPIPAYRAGYAPPPAPAGVTAVEPTVKIPEGARSVLTDKGWIYTLDEKTWISAETGEPIPVQ